MHLNCSDYSIMRSISQSGEFPASLSRPTPPELILSQVWRFYLGHTCVFLALTPPESPNIDSLPGLAVLV